MARTIIGELIVRLTDGVTGKAKQVVGAINQVDAAARRAGKGTGKGFDSLANSLKRAELAAKGLAASGAGIADWGSRFQGQLARLRASADDIDKIRASWNRLQADLKSGNFDNAFRTNAVKAWKAETAGALAAVRHEAQHTEKVLGAATLRGLGRKAAILTGFGAGVYGVGYAARRGGRNIARVEGAFERQKALDWMTGMTAADSGRLGATAMEYSSRYPSIGQTTMHEALRESAMAMRSVPKALEIADTMAKSLVVLQALKGKDQAIDESRKFFQGLSVLGRIEDPERIAQLFNGFIKATQVEGKDLNLGDMWLAAKRAKSAGAAISDRFTYMVLPDLMQEMGAQRIGTALGSNAANLFGGVGAGRATKQSRAYQQQLGLRDAKGTLAGGTMALTDPDLWTDQFLIPALQKAKVDVDDPGKVVSELSKAFSNQMVADMYAKLITQRHQRYGKQEAYTKAKGAEGADELRQRDLLVAGEGVKQQFINVVQNALEPYAGRATAALNSVADALARISNTVKENKLAGEVALPGGVAAAGIATGAVGAGLIALGAPVAGTVLAGAGAMAAMGGLLVLDKSLSDAIVANLKAIDNQAKSLPGDFTFGAADGFTQRQHGLIAPPTGFMRTRREDRPPVRTIPTRPGELPEGSGLIGPAPAEPASESAAPAIHQVAEVVQAEGEKAVAAAETTNRRIGAALAQPVPAPGLAATMRQITEAVQAEGEKAAAAAETTSRRIADVLPAGAPSWLKMPQGGAADRGFLRDMIDTMGVNLQAQGGQAGTSWFDGLLNVIRGRGTGEIAGSVGHVDLSAQGSQAGNSWADSFLAAARKISGAVIGGPSVSRGPAAPGLSDGAPTAPGRAYGGRVYAGSLYRINEYEKEYFEPAVDGTIHPSLDRARGGAAARGPTSVSLSFAPMSFHGIHDVGDVVSRVQAEMEQKLADSIRGLFADYGVEVA